MGQVTYLQGETPGVPWLRDNVSDHLKHGHATRKFHNETFYHLSQQRNPAEDYKAKAV